VKRDCNARLEPTYAGRIPTLESHVMPLGSARRDSHVNQEFTSATTNQENSKNHALLDSNVLVDYRVIQEFKNAITCQGNMKSPVLQALSAIVVSVVILEFTSATVFRDSWESPAQLDSNVTMSYNAKALLKCVGLMEHWEIHVMRQEYVQRVSVASLACKSAIMNPGSLRSHVLLDSNVMKGSVAIRECTSAIMNPDLRESPVLLDSSVLKGYNAKP
jgi:hypothetical protein